MVLSVIFFFKQKTAYEMLRSLVGSEMCIRDRYIGDTKAYTVEKTDVVKGGGIVAQVEGHRVAVGLSLIHI